MLWGNSFNQVPQYTLAAITVAAVLSSHPLYAYTFPVTRLFFVRLVGAAITLAQGVGDKLYRLSLYLTRF